MEKHSLGRTLGNGEKKKNTKVSFTFYFLIIRAVSACFILISFFFFLIMGKVVHEWIGLDWILVKMLGEMYMCFRPVFFPFALFDMPFYSWLSVFYIDRVRCTFFFRLGI